MLNKIQHASVDEKVVRAFQAIKSLVQFFVLSIIEESQLLKNNVDMTWHGLAAWFAYRFSLLAGCYIDTT